MLYLGGRIDPSFFMKRYFIQVVSHPVTHFNLLIIGFFILVEITHIHAHNTMEHDIHGVVRKYCTEKPGECAEYLPESWLK